VRCVAGIARVAGTLHTLADGPLDAVVEPGEPAPVGGLSGGAPEAAASAATFPWRDAAVAVWLVLAAAGLAALAMSYATLRRRLAPRSEEHTSELQSHEKLVCRRLLEKKKDN